MLLEAIQASTTDLVIGILLAVAILVVFVVLDYRRICKRTERDHTPAEPVELKDAWKVRDRTRRGPEIEGHLGKPRVGDRSDRRAA